MLIKVARGLYKDLLGTVSSVIREVSGSKILLVTIILALVLRAILIDNAIASPCETQAYNVDERLVMNVVLRMVEEETANPHEFLYPTLYFYVVTMFVLPLHAVDSGWASYVIAARAVSLLFGMMTVIAVYFFGKMLYDKRVGLISAALLALLPLHISFSVQAKPDAMQLFFILLGLHYCTKWVKVRRGRYLYMALAFAGLAFTTKYAGLFMLPTICIAYFLSFGDSKGGWWRSMWRTIVAGFRGKVTPAQITIACLAFLVPMVAGTPYIVLSPLEFAMGIGRTMAHSAFGMPVTGAGSRLDWFDGMLQVLGSLLTVLVGLGIALQVASLRRVWVAKGVAATCVALVWVVSYFLFLFVGTQRQSAHYMLPIVPFLMVIAGFSLVTVCGRFMGTMRDKRQKPLAIAVIAILALSAINTSAYIAVNETMTESGTQYMAARWMEANISTDATIFYDLGVYVPPEFENAVLNDFEPPGEIEIYNNTYTDYDQMVITANWTWFYTAPLDYVEAAQPDYIIVSSNFYSIHLNNTRRPQMAEYFDKLFSGELNYTPIAEFDSPEVGGGVLPELDSIDALFSIHEERGPRIIVYMRN